MKKNHFVRRAAGVVLSAAFCLSCAVVPAMADTGPTIPIVPEAVGPIAPHPEGKMNNAKKVYPVGTKAFFKADCSTGTVEYSDNQKAGFTAVPSAYIQNSSYNEGNIAYGVYTTTDGRVHFVPLNDCFVEADGSYTFRHGTSDGAVVSEEVDTANKNDTTMETQFYINVENGFDPNDGWREDEANSGSTDPRVSYDITYAVQTNYDLKATVPMYVCMYGYRGNGSIVTPSKDAYKIKNYSTINENEQCKIVDITKVTQMSKIYDAEHSDEYLFAIALNDNGQYCWWYSNPGTTPVVDANGVALKPGTYVEIADKKINASGENYVIWIDTDSNGVEEWNFRSAGSLTGPEMRETVTKIDPQFPLQSDFVVAGDPGWNFGVQFGVNDFKNKTNDNNVKGLAINVTELQAQPATWKLLPRSTNAEDLAAGQLTMNMAPEKAKGNARAIDLSRCSAPLDITDHGWFLDAPATITNGIVEEADATTLGLITNAQMAGGNQNAVGCTPVVKVSYTITPAIEIDSVKVDSQNTNRDPSQLSNNTSGPVAP